MSKQRGRGIAAVNYPTGMNLGGDPTQALIHSTTTGNFVITISSTDLGQGAKTALAQIGADAMGVPVENVIIDTGDTDTGPHCMGTFASRLTHRAGNAIIEAADEAREVMMEVAAEELESSSSDLVTDGEGNIHVKGAPGRFITVMDVAMAAHFQQGKTISGRGIGFKPKSDVDPETGEMDPDSSEAHACMIADVEVDTETGEVDVLKIACTYEIGQVVNPALVEGQIVGGAWMGMAHALYETTEPYYPYPDNKPSNFGDYSLPGPSEVPDIEHHVLEMGSHTGPFGAKGIGEMSATPPIPAIVNAINDAIGVRITKVPVTPEDVLRALEEKEENDGGDASETAETQEA
ncbi:xanthine dehydrogenase family protein molybdopterin-binding subunit (plasmid) [Salinigranum rubrum]|uniref:Xanthine dehydrogenase family protein molybdopterin-binding subunit n=1 Tax=Salinigranum rubrum TaxID=755307 RepID=A0A2I8VQL5_9EURY|nr:molybdopterin cofactor-binding domain-containing protein [Salinigranum rubrum]AUV84174.1 xanthine dehydrogenase family protein molybdopterin-binding subunit [Salinigranum rubrum]